MNRTDKKVAFRLLIWPLKNLVKSMPLLTGPQGQGHPQHPVSVLWLLFALTPLPGPTTAEASCFGPLAASPRSSIASRGCSSTRGLLMHTPCRWNIMTRPSLSCQLGDHLSHARLELTAEDLPELHGTPSFPLLGSQFQGHLLREVFSAGSLYSK